MSTSSKSRLSKLSLALLAASMTASLAFAGITNAGEKKKHTKIESMATVPDLNAKKANVLKCWQEGRLIFKAGNIKAGKDKLPGAIRIRAKNGKTLQLLDFKQGMCILDQS